MPAGKAWLTKLKNELEFSFPCKTQNICSISPLTRRGQWWPGWHYSRPWQSPAVKVIPPKRVRPQEISLQTADFF